MSGGNDRSSVVFHASQTLPETTKVKVNVGKKTAHGKNVMGVKHTQEWRAMMFNYSPDSPKHKSVHIHHRAGPEVRRGEVFLRSMSW